MVLFIIFMSQKCEECSSKNTFGLFEINSDLKGETKSCESNGKLL